MICEQCKKDFPEKDVQESHDVPCYLFKGFNRNKKKNQADKYGRHWLCTNCHNEYEEAVRQQLILIAQLFATKYFASVK